jgi:hypothetical protein
MRQLEFLKDEVFLTTLMHFPSVKDPETEMKCENCADFTSKVCSGRGLQGDAVHD